MILGFGEEEDPARATDLEAPQEFGTHTPGRKKRRNIQGFFPVKDGARELAPRGTRPRGWHPGSWPRVP